MTGGEQAVFGITFSWENGQSSCIYQFLSQFLHSWTTSARGSFVRREQVAFLKRAKLGIRLKFWRLPWFQYFCLQVIKIALPFSEQSHLKNGTFLLVGVRGLEHTHGTVQILQP